MANRTLRNVILAGGLTTAFLCLTGILASAADAPADWPQWRGPSGTGSAAENSNPPTQWGPEKNIKWKVKLPGSGSSTPVVAGDKVFVQTAIPVGDAPAAPAAAAAQPPAASNDANRGGGGGREGRGQGRGGRGGGFGGAAAAPTQPYQFVLMCLDRKTGQTLWQQVAREVVPHEGHHRDHGFSSHSPVTDGVHVYAYFGSRGLHCYDMTGKRLWEKDLGRQQTKMSFGEGSSPALYKDTIVINWDHEGNDFLVALDKATGNEKWRTKRDEPTTWSTPLVVEHEGKAQVIVQGTNRVRAYDLANGKEIWNCRGLTQNVIPTPVAADGVVYLTSGFRGAALLAVKLGREGDLTGTDAILWTREKATPYVPSPLLAGGKLYMFSGNSNVLSCFDIRTGQPLIDAKRVDELENVYASPVAAGEHLYFVGRDGTTVVMKHAEPGKLEELAVNELKDPIDASPAIAGNELFLRGRGYLYCIAGQQPGKEDAAPQRTSDASSKPNVQAALSAAAAGR